MATPSIDTTRLAQTLAHLPLQPRPSANALRILDILALPTFDSSHLPRLETLSRQPRPFRVKLKLTIYEAMVLSALAESPLRSEVRSLEFQPGPAPPRLQAVHNMLDAIKKVLPTLPAVEHFHYVEELHQIMQIDEDLIRVLFNAERLHHLALGRFTVDNNLNMSKVLPVNCTWRLTTINLVQFRTGADNIHTKNFLADLLASVRKTVRALTLDVEVLEIRSIAGASPEEPVFPTLEHVAIKNARMGVETATAVYLAPKLRSISLSPHDDRFQDDEFYLDYAMPATVPGSRIADVIVQDMILAPLAHCNVACVSLSVSAGPCLADAPTFLYLSDMKKLEQIRLEIQPQTSPAIPIIHKDVMTQLQSLGHLRCLIIDGHVESRLAPDAWQDQTLDKSQEEDRLATLKDDLLALAATYAITFPKLRVLGIEHCWFEFDTVTGVSTIVKALFESAVVAKEPYVLKASFRVDEHMCV